MEAIMSSWQQMLNLYFVQSGAGLAAIGAALTFSLGGIGSAKGISISGGQAAGILSEKPDLFGKLLVIMALPGTQGFYGLICTVMTAMKTGLYSGKITVSPAQGLVIFFVSLGAGLVQLFSAIAQGEAAAASANFVAKNPGEAGKAILIPALVETYAVLALLADILLLFWVTKANF
ncbi:MAG: V-type ATP synthase subunit K [bacterium]